MPASYSLVGLPVQHLSVGYGIERKPDGSVSFRRRCSGARIGGRHGDRPSILLSRLSDRKELEDDGMSVRKLAKVQTNM